MSHLEDTLLAQIRLAKLPEPIREFHAIAGRRFRWDFCWTEPYALLVEVQGGTWINGGHSRGAGVSRDCEKLNLATLSGWKVLAFTGDQIHRGEALSWLQAFFSSVAA